MNFIGISDELCIISQVSYQHVLLILYTLKLIQIILEETKKYYGEIDQDNAEG